MRLMYFKSSVVLLKLELGLIVCHVVVLFQVFRSAIKVIPNAFINNDIRSFQVFRSAIKVRYRFQYNKLTINKLIFHNSTFS